MSDRPEQNAFLMRLIDAYCEDDLTQDQARQLERILEVDEKACRFFLSYMAQNASLNWRFRDRPVGSIGATHQVSEPKPLPKLGRRPWIAAAAMLLLALGLGLAVRALWVGHDQPALKATIVLGHNPVWAGTPMYEQQVLPAGPHKLKSGLVYLEASNGARLVIEGPAHFEFSGPKTLYLHAGKLHAEVPESGHGFTVQTDSAKFVDLGTRFGVTAKSHGPAELHVLEGRVEAFARATPRKSAQMLTAGSAVRILPDGLARSIRPAGNHFVSPDQLVELRTRSRGRNRHVRSMGRDPELAMLIDFEKTQRGQTPNLAAGYARASVPNVWLHAYKNTLTRSRTPLSIGRWVRYRHLGPRNIRLEVEDQGGPPHDDLIVELQHATNGKTRIWARKRSSHSIPGFTHELLDQDNLSLFGEIKGQGQRWVIKTPQPDPARMVDVTLGQGRMHQTTAARFEQSRSRVDVPLVRTTVTSLTLAAWIRIEPNGQIQPLLGPQSALQINDWTWQVEPDGRISIRLHTAEGLKAYRSDTPLPVRKWIYGSAVIDASHRQVVHLLNGDPINTLTTHAAMAEAKIGPMRIGRDTQNNRFTGQIDEMAMWVRAVSSDQLLQLYEQTRPSPIRP